MIVDAKKHFKALILELRRCPTNCTQVKLMQIFGEMFLLERVFFDIKGAYLWTKARDLTFCWASHCIRRTVVEVLGETYQNFLPKDYVCEVEGGCYGYNPAGDLWAELVSGVLTSEGYESVAGEDSLYGYFGVAYPEDFGELAECARVAELDLSSFWGQHVLLCLLSLFVDDGAASGIPRLLTRCHDVIDYVFEVKIWLSGLEPQRMLAFYYSAKRELIPSFSSTIYVSSEEYNTHKLQKIWQFCGKIGLEIPNRPV